MKLAFLVLLLANVALFAWQRGFFGPVFEAGREPQRVAHQVAPERIRVLTPEQLEALRSTATPAIGNTSAKAACLVFGDFDEANLARVQARLTTLALGERLQARQVEGPGWYIVYLPPLPSRADAERVAQDLRARGIRDLAVMGETSAIRNAIALGSFREQELAQRRAAELQQRGINGIRVSERASTTTATRFEIREVDAALTQQLAEIQKEFPQSQLGACAK
jgi:cell division protein FtsN